MKFLHKNTLITETKLLKECKKLTPYIKKLQQTTQVSVYNTPETVINLPFDETAIKEIIRIKEKLATKNLKYLLLVGIGGSNLGAKAIYDAMYGYFDSVEPTRFPKMIFVDTTSAEYLYKLTQLLREIKPEEVLINVVSKSGKTIETIANLQLLVKEQLKDRTVITTKKDSGLWKKAQQQTIECFTIPEKISGRYSVFSAVGLFPLVATGFDIIALLEGAMEMRKHCLTTNILGNPAIISAYSLYKNSKEKKTINNNFFFHPELESLGKWYRQLMAESIGKHGKGITPTVSIGSTDLHSMEQLYIGGPKDKYFTLITVENEKHKIQMPRQHIFSEIIPEINGKTSTEIMDAITDAVRTIFVKKKIPFGEIVLADISERALGQFMQFKMLETMYLARLLDVNAFDQPNVEGYKEQTWKLLQSTKTS